MPVWSGYLWRSGRFDCRFDAGENGSHFLLDGVRYNADMVDDIEADILKRVFRYKDDALRLTMYGVWK